MKTALETHPASPKGRADGMVLHHQHKQQIGSRDASSELIGFVGIFGGCSQEDKY